MVGSFRRGDLSADGVDDAAELLIYYIGYPPKLSLKNIFKV